MKKVLTVCLVFAMIIAMSVQVFAEPGAFTNSPSKNKAPILVSATNESEECIAQIIITAYGDRDQLSPEARKNIEEAYSMIVGAEYLDSLIASIEELANKLGVKVSDLAVSDLFDISATDCNGHEDHGHFDIVLKADTLKNFVCLLHYYNGEWRIVDNVQVTNNGEHLEFDEDEFSPFAIVVSTVDLSDDASGEQPGGEQPGDDDNNNGVWIAVGAGIILLLIAIIIAVILLKKKKKI